MEHILIMHPHKDQQQQQTLEQVQVIPLVMLEQEVLRMQQVQLFQQRRVLTLLQQQWLQTETLVQQVQVLRHLV